MEPHVPKLSLNRLRNLGILWISEPTFSISKAGLQVCITTPHLYVAGNWTKGPNMPVKYSANQASSPGPWMAFSKTGSVWYSLSKTKYHVWLTSTAGPGSCSFGDEEQKHPLWDAQESRGGIPLTDSWKNPFRCQGLTWWTLALGTKFVSVNTRTAAATCTPGTPSAYLTSVVSSVEETEMTPGVI